MFHARLLENIDEFKNKLASDAIFRKQMYDSYENDIEHEPWIEDESDSRRGPVWRKVLSLLKNNDNVVKQVGKKKKVKFSNIKNVKKYIKGT